MFQSSRTTARVCSQEEFVTVDTMYTDECTPAKISVRIREIAFDAMAQSAVYEDIDPVYRPFGVFKKKHLSCALNFAPFRYSLTYIIFFVCVAAI